MILEKTVFVTEGQTFDSEAKALQFRADLIGEFMDKGTPDLSPRQRINLNDFVVTNRAALARLLSY